MGSFFFFLFFGWGSTFTSASCYSGCSPRTPSDGTGILLCVLPPPPPLPRRSFRLHFAFRLDNLRIASTGGDGVFVRGLTTGHFSRLVLDDNFRQGMSIDGATDLLVEDCKFVNTGQGAAASPACGVDMEPDWDFDRLWNITFRRCIAANNTGCGFSISPHNLLKPVSGGGDPGPEKANVSIRFEDCAVDNRGQLNATQCERQLGGCGWSNRAGWVLSGFPPAIRGTVTLEHCIGQGGQGPMLLFEAKGGNSSVVLANSRFSNDGMDPKGASPVVEIRPTSTGKYVKAYGPVPVRWRQF